MIKRILSVILISCAAHTMTAQTPTRVTVAVSEKQLERCPNGPYEATWQSMAENYQVPEWFKDAKFGIFIHWGLYSVPAMGSEWYPKHMYNAMWGDHRKHFGDQLHFGYKDFIPKFRAENFDAHEWQHCSARPVPAMSSPRPSTTTASPCTTQNTQSGMRRRWGPGAT